MTRSRGIIAFQKPFCAAVLHPFCANILHPIRAAVRRLTCAAVLQITYTTALQLVCAVLLHGIFPVSVHAQSPSQPGEIAPADTLVLEEILIQATRYPLGSHQQPVRIARFDADEISIYTGEGISRILEERSMVLVRDYGPGGLSTLSFRGLSPGQTQVLWNGFRINDPMSGLVDFSLIPTRFIQSMEVGAGTSSTSFGSGASGGTVHIDTRSRNRGASLWQSVGSFGRNIQGISGGWHEGGWHGSLMLQRENSENDFRFRNGSAPGSPMERRTHNAIEGLHALLSAGYDHSSWRVGSTFWFYDVQNQVPGPLTWPSEALQTDRAFRWLSRAEWNSGVHDIDLSLLVSRNSQGYEDEWTEPGTNLTRLVAAEISWSVQPHESITLTQVAGVSGTRAETPFFESNPSQIAVSLQFNPVWKATERLRLFPAIRYDYYDISGDAISSSLGFNYRFGPGRWILRGQVSRNFVAPGFNDLFWVPGGNPDLKPEINRKGDLGLLWRQSFQSLRGESELTLFAGHYDDGIKWIPDPVTGAFIAHNVEEILTRGAEFSTEWDLALSPAGGIGASAGVRYNRSTVEADGTPQSPAIGKQLIFTPLWVVQTGLSGRYRAFSAGVNASWFDKRHTSQDHSVDPLDEYHLSSAWIRADLPLGPAGLELTARLRNLLDHQYQVMEGYPLPGRHFILSARLYWSAK